MPTRLSIPRRRGLLLGAIVAVLLVFPAISFAAIFQYAQGYNGAGGSWQTQYYGNRSFNRVYHKDGTYWRLSYCDPGGCPTPYSGTVNPLVDSRAWNNAKAFCYNINDNSGVLWTCQTTS